MTDWKDRYAAARQGSKALFDRAERLFANGATHDIRVQNPFPIYVNRAQGAYKWDVDGIRYVDYVMGHGALLLGHSHPAVVEAVCAQMAKGSHYGACHELEVRWGELVQRLVPSAERVRFVSSGTEAVLMALRLARAFTGRSKVLKLAGHFHGWNDYAMAGSNPRKEAPLAPGIPATVLESVAVVAPGDTAAIEAALRTGEIAGAIVEPSGAHFGQVPLPEGFLATLRRLCSEHSTLLIFDEVVTGFRYSPGGVQAVSGIKPDITTLAKILAGGLPGGAVVGRADVMAAFELRDQPEWNQTHRVYHPGTFNANPLSAAAGVTALDIVATGQAQTKADELARSLRAGLGDVLRRLDIPGVVYGDCSVFHIYLGPVTTGLAPAEMPIGVRQALRGAMLAQGIDLLRCSGFLSASHSAQDVEQSVAAFGQALELLRADRAI